MQPISASLLDFDIVYPDLHIEDTHIGSESQMQFMRGLHHLLSSKYLTLVEEEGNEFTTG